ncbi:hypothetical protein H6A16_07585 [Collinsella tanakaei]|uniref:hypothetical protein n=1 Tax=Collinsella tanakaei TaxID=626935 RepID=UPI00195DBE32|nr:hypothetical protein [Collinsella tanakaei]MBM6779348.1 hypothetical protein [Collinsella tanakaei]
MAEEQPQELTAEEAERLAGVEHDRNALAALVDDLSGHSRLKRQLAARVVHLLAQREPALLEQYIPDLIDALYRPEAQTRWEILDALTLLVPDHAREVGAAYDGAEAALFDDLSATLRLSAFRLLCAWGATERGRSKKVWPILDEAIQCYHGDLEYRDMLGCLLSFAEGKIEGGVAGELAGRLQFDAENGKGSYLKARSAEIYNLLVKRFKLDNPQKRARVAVKSDDMEDDEE